MHCNEFPKLFGVLFFFLAADSTATKGLLRAPNVTAFSPYLNYDTRFIQQAQPEFIFPEGASKQRGRFELAFSQIGSAVMVSNDCSQWMFNELMLWCIFFFVKCVDWCGSGRYSWFIQWHSGNSISQSNWHITTYTVSIQQWIMYDAVDNNTYSLSLDSSITWWNRDQPPQTHWAHWQ